MRESESAAKSASKMKMTYESNINGEKQWRNG
jgi:hypothetical protein